MRPPAASLPVVYLDGAFVPAARARVSVFDRGLLVADGVFDTLLVLEGVPLSLDAHLARLAGSADFMMLDLYGCGNYCLMSRAGARCGTGTVVLCGHQQRNPRHCTVAEAPSGGGAVGLRNRGCLRAAPARAAPSEGAPTEPRDTPGRGGGRTKLDGCV